MEELEQSQIGERIRIARQNAGLGQGQVASQLGVRQPTMSRWEQGESVIPARFILPMAKMFNVTADSLLGGEDLPTQSIKTARDLGAVIDKKDQELKELRALVARIPELQKTELKFTNEEIRLIRLFRKNTDSVRQAIFAVATANVSEDSEDKKEA